MVYISFTIKVNGICMQFITIPLDTFLHTVKYTVASKSKQNLTWISTLISNKM